jgi:hypothetical protein
MKNKNIHKISPNLIKNLAKVEAKVRQKQKTREELDIKIHSNSLNLW